jgi:hypothetical protein
MLGVVRGALRKCVMMMAEKKTKNDDGLLRAVLSSQIRTAIGYDEDGLSGNRTEAWKRYEGDAYGDERPDRSKVMSRDVFEVVEEIMPSLVRIFLGQDHVIQFRDEDEEAASLATEYVGDMMRTGDSFEQIYDWMKSSIISSSTALKFWWDETPTYSTEEYEGVTEQGLAELNLDDDVEVLWHEDAEPLVPEPMEMAPGQFVQPPPMPRWNIKIRRANTEGRLRLEAIPSDEFLISRRATTLEDRRTDFIAHRTLKTRTELRQAGYEEADIEKLEAANDETRSQEALERTDGIDDELESTALDEAMTQHWVYYCHIRHDYDGDGIAEWRYIVVGNGPDNPVIFENEEIEEIPYAVLTAIRVPFRFNGYGIAETVLDVQRWKTTLLRLSMDGFYHSVFPQKQVLDGQVNLDDALNQAPGGFVRVKQIGAIAPYAEPWKGAEAFPMLEYVDGTIQRRSGVRPMGTALDPNVLQNETAEGVREVSATARARVELIARCFAETGFRQLAQGILKLIVRNSRGPKSVRLGGRLREIDPTNWNALMDARPVVGLGNGNKEQEMQRIGMIAAKQEQILLQAGPDNPLVGLGEYYHTLVDLSRATGAVDPDRYWRDPQPMLDKMAQQPKEQPPDPKMMEAQAKMQIQQQEAQARLAMEKQKAEAELVAARERAALETEQAREKMQADIAMQRERMTMDAQAMREKFEMEHRVAVQRMEMEFALKREELGLEAQLETMKMAAGSRDGQGNILTVSDTGV